MISLSDLEESILKSAIIICGERALDLPPYFLITVIVAGVINKVNDIMLDEDYELIKKYFQKWRLRCKDVPKI